MKQSDYISLVNTLVSMFARLPSFASETDVRANVEKLLHDHSVGIDPVPPEVPTPRRKEPAPSGWATEVVSTAVAAGWKDSDPAAPEGYNAKRAAIWMAHQLRAGSWATEGLYDEYTALHRVLRAAYDQAAVGKGAERHANSRSFEQQPMQSISDLLGDNHGLLFQAVKKVQESTRMPHYRLRERELLGAINYIAGAIIFDLNHSIPEDNGDAD